MKLLLLLLSGTAISIPQMMIEDAAAVELAHYAAEGGIIMI
jgi:sugar phosphate permease